MPRRRGDGTLIFAGHPEFRPNLSPAEIFRRGSFGGGYWRPIHSAVTGRNYVNVHKKYPAAWFRGAANGRGGGVAVTNAVYDKSANRYGVKVGMSLEYWEAHGWISPRNPYGWVHW